MLNLLWSALNVALLLGICYSFFRAARLVNQHLGLGAALFFGFGLLIVSSRADSPSTAPKNLLTGVPSDAPLGNASSVQHINLGGSNVLMLLAEYRTGGDTIVPRGLFATVSGITLGHQWEPVAGLLTLRGSQLHYTAIMNHQWRLFGRPLFTSGGEIFEGLLPATPVPR